MDLKKQAETTQPKIFGTDKLFPYEVLKRTHEMYPQNYQSFFQKANQFGFPYFNIFRLK